MNAALMYAALGITGIELANGYHELCDDDEFLRRFEQDTLPRKNDGHLAPGVNHRLSAALEAGLPESAGVALGFDRLLMLAAGCDSISEVVIFTVANA